MTKQTEDGTETVGKIPTALLIAIIGLIGTLIAGLLASPLLPILLGGGKPASDAPSIQIVGPDQAPLNRKDLLHVDQQKRGAGGVEHWGVFH